MAAKPSIDPARFLHDQLTSTSPDLLRSLLTTFVDARHKQRQGLKLNVGLRPRTGRWSADYRPAGRPEVIGGSQPRAFQFAFPA